MEQPQEVQFTPAGAYRADRTIALALPFGVLAVWAVSLVMGGSADRVDAGVATILAVGLVLLGLIAALVMRGRAVALSDAARRDGSMAEPARLGAMRVKLIIAWAVLEATALLVGVSHFVWGVDRVLMYAAPIYLLGVALTYPRAEWYGVDERGRTT